MYFYFILECLDAYESRRQKEPQEEKEKEDVDEEADSVKGACSYVWHWLT